MQSFAVIGLGQFGYSVAQTLSENGAQVLAIDKDLEKIQNVRDIVTQAVQLNALDEKSLKAIGVSDIDIALVSIGTDLEASILISMTLKQLGVKEVIAKALNDTHAKVLEKVGVSRIIFPEREMGMRLATGIMKPNLLEHINLSKNYSIVEISPPGKIVGKSICDAQVRAKYHVDIVAVRSTDGSEHGQITVVPEPDYPIKKDDKLIVVGHKDYLEKFSN